MWKLKSLRLILYFLFSKCSQVKYQVRLLFLLLTRHLTVTDPLDPHSNKFMWKLKSLRLILYFLFSKCSQVKYQVRLLFLLLTRHLTVTDPLDPHSVALHPNKEYLYSLRELEKTAGNGCDTSALRIFTYGIYASVL